MTVWEQVDGLKGWLEYNAQLFDDTTISRLSSDFVLLLNTIVTQPDLKLSDLDQILIDANREFQLARVRDSQETRSQKFKTTRRRAISVA